MLNDQKKIVEGLKWKIAIKKVLDRISKSQYNRV